MWRRAWAQGEAWTLKITRKGSRVTRFGPTDLRLQGLLLGGGEQHVVQDQPVPRTALVQRQVGRWVADRVLRILGVMAAEVGPSALAVVAVDVLHPGRTLFGREDDVAVLQSRLGKRRGDAVEIVQHRAVIL